MADYDAKIRVSADTKQAESEISQLQQRLNKLSDAAFKLDARNFQKSVKDIGTAVQGIGQRGALGALTLAAGKATTALGGLGAKFGILGAAAASAGATVNGALGGIPAVITDILNQVGQIPNAFGIAAVAALAFAPQVLKASAAVTGLGAAVDNAIGKQTTEKIANVVDKFGQLKLEIDATYASFQDLISGSTLNQLNTQLKDAVKQSGEFLSSTDEAVTAAQQLVAVQREQRKEQKAINDLIRQAQGLQPQDVRDTEVARRVALLKSREVQQSKDLQLQSQINAELAEYAKIAEQVAAQTKQWASNLERVSRTSKAGALGTQSQLRTRLQEFQENRRSAEIARQRSAEILALERGGQYSLGQVPVRGELFPGGRSETAAPQFRERLNIQALAQQALEKAGRSRLQIEASIFKQSKQISEVQQEQNRLDERSVQLAKERNKLLLEQFRAEQRVAAGTLDPASLRANRQRRVTKGRETAARRREALSNAVIGGAFPLLFGQGAGAALGGGLGGAAGGFAGGQFGFGLALVGTALGQAFDTLITKSTELGGALLKVSDTFNTLKERSLISNREREKELQILQDAGFAASANAAAQEELFKTIGARGVDSLRELGSESDRLNRTWAELSVQLQAVVAGPLADFASVLNQFFKPSAIAGRVEALRQDLNPQDRQKLNEELRVLATKGTFRPTGALNRTELEALATFKPEQVQEALDRFGKLRVNADVKLDPAQARQELVNILQKQLEVIDIVRKFEQAGEKQQELDRQRFDLIEGYEQSIAAIRRRVEDEVTNKRLALIQKENELLDIQARIRQESLSLANQQAVATAGAGLPTQARDAARRAAEAAGTFQEQELSIAEQSAKLKRDSALEALRTDIQAARFQAETAREVSRLNIDTARRVADINAGVRKQNAQQDTLRFDIEKKLAIIRLQATRQEFALLAGQVTPISQPEDADNLRKLAEDNIKLITNSLSIIQKVKAPAPLSEIGAVGGQGVSTAALNTLTEKLKAAESAAVSAQLALNDLLSLKNEEEFKAKIAELAESIEAPFDNLDEELANKVAERQRYAELIKEGVRGVVAGRIIEIEKLENIAVLQFEAAIAELEKKRAVEGTNKALEDQIKALEERRDAIAGRAAGAIAKTKEQESPAQRLKDAAIKAREELTELLDISNQIENAAKAIGTAFSQSFIDLVSGTASAQQALASFFKSVGDYFLETANKIIAKLIEIYILETIVGFISGAVAPSSATSAASKAKATGKRAFAEGGFVTGPTRALIGEGGEPEYVIPASKMGSAMARYAAGARGEGVLGGAVAENRAFLDSLTTKVGGSVESAADEPSDGTVATRAAIRESERFQENRMQIMSQQTALERRYERERLEKMTSEPGYLNVKYESQVINNVEYVTRDQAERLATQSALRGRELAIGALQNSVKTRKRVGMS